MSAPACPTCQQPLDRVDHYAVEHLILDENVYRPLNVVDGDGLGGFGLASETILRCRWCQTQLPQDLRKFFYQRWYQLGLLK